MPNGQLYGAGTEADPYQIQDPLDLYEFCSKQCVQYQYSYVVLVNDIDLNVEPFNSGVGFNVPYNSSYFRGVFDGQGFIVKNFFNRSNSAYTGLFPNVYAATIRNVGMVNISVSNTSQTYQAGLVGYATSNTLIENCYVKNGILSAGAQSGCICGGIYGSTIIRNCYATGVTITPYNSNVGGIVGTTQTTGNSVYNCYVSVTFASIYAGANNGAVIGGLSNSSADRYYNLFYDYSQTNGRSSTNDTYSTALSNDNLKKYNYVYQLNSGNTPEKIIWILAEGQLPRLFFEDLSKFLLLEEGRPITNIAFGSVLEGSKSRVKKLRFKNGYRFTIKELKVEWERADGTSDLTELEFSMDGSFTDNANPMTISNQDVGRGEEFTFFARVSTKFGMAGTGSFNITVTATMGE